MIVRLGILAALSGLAACASSGSAGRTAIASGKVSRWTGSFRATNTATSAVLAPATPNRGTGTITVTPLGGTPAQMRVELSISTANGSNTQLAWALFSGGCGSPGPMVAGQNSFPPISVSSSGDGRIRTDLAFSLDAKSAYHANVYWTSRANDMNDVMMCANLQPEG